MNHLCFNGGLNPRVFVCPTREGLVELRLRATGQELVELASSRRIRL